MHGVTFHRDVLPEKTPDEIVCLTALDSKAILVSADGDMKQFAKRYGVTPNGDRYAALHVIRLCCNEVLAAKRLDQAMPLIELEWVFATAKAARRMWIDIGPHWITTHR